MGLEHFGIAIYAMLMAGLLPLGFSLLAKLAGGVRVWGNANPRGFLGRTEGMAARAHGAEKNSYETLPFFFAAILMAQYMVVPQAVINKLALAYVLLRVLYGLAYVLNFPSLRSILWTLALACPVLLLVISAQS